MKQPPSHCGRHHDLTKPGNLRVDSGRWRCLACLREDARVRRRNARQDRMHDVCVECGLPKWRDRRTRCLKCAHAATRGMGTVDLILERAVADECLMPWDRQARRSADNKGAAASASPPQWQKAVEPESPT